MNVCLVTAFRDAGRYLDRWYGQVIDLAQALFERGDQLFLVLGEGDSTDDTLARLSGLFESAPREVVQIVDCTHGGPSFGPVVDSQRFKQLAYVGQQLWPRIPAHVGAVLMIESDLLWDAITVIRMLDLLALYPCVCPLIIDNHGLFYDIWAYRRGGQHFQKMPPYHPDLPDVGGIIRIDSAGSCLVMAGSLARHLAFDEEVLVGICKQINALGAGVYLDTRLTVHHP